jgi:nicotinamide-nucleotide amidase
VEDKMKDKILNMDTEPQTPLEEILGEILISKKLTLSTAESCTGGLIASKLVNVSGISSVFMEGAVTYSNEAKINRLNVKDETLKNFGAVSEETAAEMAKGIAKTSGTNIGLSTTGIAGPLGGTSEKPVGLVYIGLYINGEIKVEKCNFLGDRYAIRMKTVTTALNLLISELLKK